MKNIISGCRYPVHHFYRKKPFLFFCATLYLGVMLNVLPAQSRAARALLNWGQDDLAREAQVGVTTVRNFEQEKATPRPAILAAMRGALERAGVELIEGNGGGAGVRLREG